MDTDFMFRLRKAMGDKGITASELSNISGVGKSDISYYLKGKYVPKQDKCFMLAKALGVDPGWLMTGIDINETLDAVHEARKMMKEMEEKASDAIDLFLSLSEEGRKSALRYMEFLKSQEKEG